MYSNLIPDGSLKLYQFIAMVTLVMILLSQFPSFHSLRHINLGSLFLSFGYTFLVVGACIYAGKNFLHYIHDQCSGIKNFLLSKAIWCVILFPMLCSHFRRCTSKGLLLRIIRIVEDIQRIHFHFHNSCHIWEWHSTRNSGDLVAPCGFYALQWYENNI